MIDKTKPPAVTIEKIEIHIVGIVTVKVMHQSTKIRIAAVFSIHV